MGATFSRSTTWSTGAVLTATALNGEFDNVLNNLTPAGIDDASANLTAMRATRDPYSGATAQLASSLEDEIQALRYQLVQITGNTYWYEDVSAGFSVLSAQLAPIGGIVAHYDFNAAVSINTSYWAYCDGSTISDANSPLDGETLPDLSNRYLVGFGTEGGGDVDSATWATAAVGNASHQIDVSHTHTGPSHTHTVGAHNHRWFIEGTAPLNGTTFQSDGSTSQTVRAYSAGAGSTNVIQLLGNVSPVSYYTEDSGSFASGAGGTGATSSSLSATQSIQPRSLRVRWIMRKR